MTGSLSTVAHASSTEYQLQKWKDPKDRSFGDSIMGYDYEGDDLSRGTPAHEYAMNLCYLKNQSTNEILANLVYCIEERINFSTTNPGYKPGFGLPPQISEETAKKIAWIVRHGFQPEKGAIPYIDPLNPNPLFGNNATTWSLNSSASSPTGGASNFVSIRNKWMSPPNPLVPLDHELTELEAFMGTQIAIWCLTTGVLDYYADLLDYVIDACYTYGTITEDVLYRHINSLELAEELLHQADLQAGDEVIKPSITVSLDNTGAQLNGFLYGPITVQVKLSPATGLSITPSNVPVKLTPNFPLYSDAAGSVPLNTSGYVYHGTTFYADLQNVSSLYNTTHRLASAVTEVKGDINSEQVIFFQYNDNWNMPPPGGSQGMAAFGVFPLDGGQLNGAAAVVDIRLTAPTPTPVRPTPTPSRPSGNIPKTGDGFPIGALFGGMAFALVGLVWLGCRGRSRKRSA